MDRSFLLRTINRFSWFCFEKRATPAYLKITDFKPENLYPLFEIVKQFKLQILEIKSDEILLQSVNSFERTDELINKLADGKYAVEVVRSGSVAI